MPKPPEDKHYLIDGARWHYPKVGEPTVCAVEGCDRVLADPRLRDDLTNVEADDEPPAEEPTA